MRIRVCVVMLAMALAACGGSGQPSPEATAPPQPTPVESATPTEVLPLIAPTPLPASPTPEPVAGGRLSFSDAGIVLERINLPPAADGKVYVGWLGQADGQLVNVGAIDPSHISPDPIYADPEGRSLIGLFISFQITLEDAAEAQAPAGPTALSGSVPAAALEAVRQSLIQAGTPTGQGLAVSLRAQAEVMFQHASLASDALTAGDLRGAKTHAEHVINIAAGQDSPDFGDYDGDARADNPGDGFGVAAYVRRQIDLVLSLGESGVDEQIRSTILAATGCAVSVESRALDAIQAAKEIIAAVDANEARLAGVRMVSLANAADNGTDANNNGAIESVKDECGAAQLIEIVRRLSDIPLHPPPTSAVPTLDANLTAAPAATETPVAAGSPAAAPAVEMIRIPAGAFVRGDATSGFADSRPARTITLSAYSIDRFEVTQAAYRACVAAAACPPPLDRRRFDDPAFAQHPAVFIDWNRAAAYCAWAGERLPTEAEWEKAARGEAGLRWPWGDEFDGTKLNSKAAGLGNTTATGDFPQGNSPFGVSDMAGNAWEWVADYFSASYYAESPDTDPAGPARGSERVLRGGGFANDFPRQIVSIAFRDHAPASFADASSGFRCAKDGY